MLRVRNVRRCLIFIIPITIIDKRLSTLSVIYPFRILAGGLPHRSNKLPIIDAFKDHQVHNART